MGGRPVGIVANQPRQLGGILDNDSADKAARFVNLCNAFGIPLVFLMDVPGFMVGTKVEAAGIIRHGAKMLYAVANATVPKITVVIRKAYGAGYYVMNGRAYEPDLIVAWPSAEISVMGAEGAVEIVMRRQVEEADDPAAKKAELIEAYRKIIDVYVAAGNDMIDDVIDPRETRPRSSRRARDGRAQARRAAVEAPAHRAQDEQHEHRADDRPDHAAEVELVRVADAEHVGEQHPADEGADDADEHGGDEAHRVVAGQQRAAEVAGDDADHDRRDDVSDHTEWSPDFRLRPGLPRPGRSESHTRHVGPSVRCREMQDR